MTIRTTTAARKRNEPVLCPLTDMGVIEVSGDDAEGFLNGQLSRNVNARQPPRATLAAWLDARGRVLALFRVLYADDRWLLLTRGADVEALIRRMNMFVLRDDVRLRNATADREAVAVVGNKDTLTVPPLADLGHLSGGSAAAEGGTHVIRIGPRLAWAIAPREELRTRRDRFPHASEETAAAEEVLLGLVDLVPDLAGRFTVHMLNLDRLGAVSFDKGCYPGQEIVARTQNLGRVKRRVFLFGGRLGQAPPVATALLDPGGDAVGEVVRAAAIGGAGVKLLAVVRADAVTDDLVCATDTDAPLDREALPWEQAANGGFRL